MPEEDIELSKGVIAFLDAVGTKGILSRAKPEVIVNSWSKILSMLHDKVEEFNKKRVNESCNYIAFSDTVIITINEAKVDPVTTPCNSIILMADLLLDPFVNALLEGINFRGVISMGEFYHSKNLIIGPAIDEAAAWSTYFDWIGISTTPSASLGIDILKTKAFLDQFLLDTDSKFDDYFVEYDIPIKDDKKEKAWVLSWPHKVNGAGLVEPRHRIIQAFTGQAIGPDIVKKYMNTLAFFDKLVKIGHEQKGRVFI